MRFSRWVVACGLGGSNYRFSLVVDPSWGNREAPQAIDRIVPEAVRAIKKKGFYPKRLSWSITLLGWG